MTIYARLDSTDHMISNQQDDWIKSQISTGHFGNVSEVIRELVRACQIREQETPAEIAALGAPFDHRAKRHCISNPDKVDRQSTEQAHQFDLFSVIVNDRWFGVLTAGSIGTCHPDFSEYLRRTGLRDTGCEPVTNPGQSAPLA